MILDHSGAYLFEIEHWFVLARSIGLSWLASAQPCERRDGAVRCDVTAIPKQSSFHRGPQHSPGPQRGGPHFSTAAMESAPGTLGASARARTRTMPSKDEAIEQATSLMTAFAERTGLTSDRPAQRYLWTDAFAVCNFLGLARLTGEERSTDLALQLVDQVHHVLGRYRTDDPRTGWISGLGEQEGESHPTRGGLRIGKKLPERRPAEPFDERLEWDRDGQYFHYLTKWMHALDQVSRSTRDPRFNLWARELAEVAHASFTYGTRGTGDRRMVWKMTTDLSRPLVASMGQHDPLDGFITSIQLETAASLLSSAPAGPSLKGVAADFAAMLEATEIRTADPLGLGGLLSDACRVAQLMGQGAFAGGDLLEGLLAAAQEGLSQYSRYGDWQQPAPRRLAFRELGLAIGLSAIELLQKQMAEDRRRLFAGGEPGARLRVLAPQVALGVAIVSFWLDPEHRLSRAWSEHRDINEVMLAASLVPEGFLIMSGG
jgi:hypothetical protein